jgi:RNA polymerase sigma factor (sigma-70 family)
MYTSGETALPALCARFRPLLARWARFCLARAGGGAHDADDLVQAALLRALRGIDAFDMRGEAALLGWLRRILLNEVRDELRRRRSRGEAVAIDANLAADGDPVGAVLAHERARAYASALRALNARQRRHVRLRVEHGMSFGEIAAATGGSEDGARMIVARAMRVLSEHLSSLAAAA